MGKLKLLLVAAAGLCVCLAAAAELRAFKRFSDATNEYEGVKLGSSRDEVGYRLGPPPMVFAPKPKSWPKANAPANWDPFQAIYHVGVPAWASSTGTEVRSDLPAGTSANDYDQWSWDVPNAGSSNIVADFDRRKNLIGLHCFDFSDTHKACPDHLGVAVGMTEEAVIAALGMPDKSNIESADEVKTLTYQDVGMDVLLTRGRVYGIEIEQHAGGMRLFRRFVRHSTGI
ncbi:MAG TPA: hypothetical protein VGF71_18925 [Caulobacteraceae bacterium]|jgi:hypothetical protein